MSGKTQDWRCWCSCLVMGGVLIASLQEHVFAQISQDNTLPNNSSVIREGNTFNITGGTQAGSNLFHSFKAFSVPTGGTAFFNNAVDVQNIFSRVTGGSVSNIDGLIRANGRANLFLINPNGIIFGRNAQLNIGGSFLASTASSLKFADGSQFSATSPQTTPLLTINVPIGLQFEGNAGSILNQSRANGILWGLPDVGLQVQSGNTLALVGGNVSLDGGNLFASRVELGAVAGLETVGLDVDGNNLRLSFPSDIAKADISLTNAATVVSYGDIQVQGRHIMLTDGSELDGRGLDGRGREFTVTASESVELSGKSTYGNSSRLDAYSYGTGGNLTITTRRFSALDGAEVYVLNYGAGAKGNLTVTASEFVDLSGGGLFTQRNYTPGDAAVGGDAANINITTKRLLVRDGAKISSGTEGEGPAGTLTVTAPESVKVIGTDTNNNPSSLSTNTSSAGTAGNLIIKTGQFTAQQGGYVTTSTSGAGNAGNLIIQASDSVDISGGGGIIAQTAPGSTGAGGNLTIETERLQGTQFAVRSLGLGPAGKLTIITPASLSNLGTQIVPDETLSINSTVRSDFNTSFIEGGTQVRNNLFHSFAQFSLPTLSTAYFNNSPNIQNIIARVTGSSASNIDGKLQANGTANLFLLNPNGIIFGPNASLDIGGSFLGSTATRLNFADGIQFSATSPQSTPLLSTSVPTGLQFEGTARELRAQGDLTVKPSRTLALVGGNVSLDGANLYAPGGSVELGGVGGTGTVDLNIVGNNLGFSFPDSVTRADVLLTNGSEVNVTGGGGGSIAINVRDLDLSKGSSLLAGIAERFGTFGSHAGDITLNATGVITISNSTITNKVSFNRLTNAGNINTGNAGNININAEALFLTDSSRIFTYTNGQGRAGNVSVQANKVVSFIDGGIYTGNLEQGDTGNISVQSNGSISFVDSFLSSGGVSFFAQGDAGNVSVSANDSVSFINSSIYTGNQKQGNAGNVSVQANRSISFLDSGISTTTFGQRNSGDIAVQTNALRLSDNASLSATTAGEGHGGNIIVDVNTLEMTRGGQILTSGFKSGDAGSITVNAKDSVTISGSNPNLSNDFYNYGEVSSASGLFANTTERSSGQGGSIRIETGRLNVRDAAEVTVSSAGLGNAGSLTVNANSIYLDKGKLAGTTASGRGGDINLQVQDLILMRRGSQISTSAGTAQQSGDGGNITINAPNGFIVTVPKENSDIKADAFTGKGGRVDITANGIFGIVPQKDPTDNSDITASSKLGVSGEVAINTPDTDPSRGLIQLPSNLVDASQQIASGCTPGGRQTASRFVATGRGGLPLSPNEPLRGRAVITGWVDLPPQATERVTDKLSVEITDKKTTASVTKPTNQIVEAQGWIVDGNGDVILVAQSPQSSSIPSAMSCSQ